MNYAPGTLAYLWDVDLTFTRQMQEEVCKRANQRVGLAYISWVYLSPNERTLLEGAWSEYGKEIRAQFKFNDSPSL